MARLLSMLDAVLASALFWGFVTLVLAAIALSGKFSMRAANVLLFAAMVTAFVGLWRSDLSQLPWIPRSLITILAMSTLALGAYYLSAWLDSKPDADKIRPIPPPPQIVELLVNCRHDVLPFSVAPKTTAYILPLYPAEAPQILPGMTQGLFEFRNSGNENLSWPEKYEMEGVVSPETSRECNITNHGEAPVLNISLKFNSIFKEEKTGKAVFSKTDQFVINAIAPGATFTFHVVNQSPFLVEANYPQEATLRIRGESMERIVPLTYSNTVLDLAGQQPFAPSYIHWRGVPKQAQSTKTVAPIVIPNSSNARPTFVPKATFSPIEGENNDAAAKRRLATRQGLTQLMEEAEQLLRKCEDMSKPAPQAQVDDWKRRAEKFLETNLDRSFVLRFRIALPYSSGTSGLDEAHGNLWREVYSRWMHLAEFLNKLD